MVWLGGPLLCTTQKGTSSKVSSGNHSVVVDVFDNVVFAYRMDVDHGTVPYQFVGKSDRIKKIQSTVVDVLYVVRVGVEPRGQHVVHQMNIAFLLYRLYARIVHPYSSLYMMKEIMEKCKPVGFYMSHVGSSTVEDPTPSISKLGC